MRGALMTILLVCSSLPSFACADDAERSSKTKEAIERGLKVVTRGAANYPQHRKCFSCHHQTLPLMAMAQAKDADYAIDSDVFDQQLHFTKTFFVGRIEKLPAGERIEGAAATITYGLWTYEIAAAQPDTVTDGLVKNLLSLQQEDGRWQPPSFRPPLVESHVSCTVLAGYALRNFARGDQQRAADAALKRADQWLSNHKLENTEDHVFLLLWQAWNERDEPRSRQLAGQLLEMQRADGGWGQTVDMKSDAYATGQVLYALKIHAESDTTASRRKGVDYLLSTQQADGSWHVKSRAKPLQKYFDNGDPHGTDQFISIAATSWAIVALAINDADEPHRSP
jgi:N-acyl-D-amino-acid deacylase